jgi:hypothetical protein
MKLGPIIVRVRAEVAAFSNRVGGVAELEAAIDNKELAVPHAFVYRLEDLPEESDEIGAGTQAMNETFGVLVAVANTGDARGAAADDQLDDLRDALIAALKGWSPEGAHQELDYRGFETVEVTRARVWRRFDFATLTSI